MSKQLLTWIEERNNLLQRFQEYWSAQHERDPKNFPLELEGSAWQEQLQDFETYCCHELTTTVWQGGEVNYD